MRTQCTNGSTAVALMEPPSQPAQHASVPTAAISVRAQWPGVALAAPRSANSRRSMSLSSARSSDSIGGSGGAAGGLSESNENTYSP
eukprot:scaffold59691_cov31-Tisochrysis_lutea.AAC.2